MARHFRLAGLLRIRELQEAQAAGKLAAANASLREGAAQSARAREAAEQSADEADSAEALMAIAAARSSTSSFLLELDGLVSSLSNDAGAATREYHQARRGAVVLQKLQDRHLETLAHEDLAREQHTLDELAARGAARTEGETP